MTQPQVKEMPPSGKLSGGCGLDGLGTKSFLHSTTRLITTDGAGGPGVARAGARRSGGDTRERNQADRQYADAVEDKRRMQELHDGTVTYLLAMAQWQSFITLTLSDAVVGPTRMTPEALTWKWRYLIRVLNTDLLGDHYTRIVHHSYFAYAMAIEPHTKGRDQIHLHAIVDRRINYRLLHDTWNRIAGHAWIERIDDVNASVRYTCKYIIKGGVVEYYKPQKYKEPSFKPMWYETPPGL
jgi:hypothetical protein